MADKPEDLKDKTPVGDNSAAEKTEAGTNRPANGAVQADWTQQENSVVKDARTQGGTDKLPGVSIQSDVTKPASDASSAMSWATKSDLAAALRYLEAVRPSAEAELRAPAKSGGDRAQFNVYQMLNEKVLPALQKEIGPDWKLFPSKPHSPADKVGADFLLVNTKTGEFHFVDATTNPDKRNVFDLRARGVVLIDNALFDQFGALKEDDNNPEKREAAKELRESVTQQMREMIKQGSVFKLGKDGTPMPSLEVKSDEQTKIEIDRLGSWATGKSKTEPTLADKFRQMGEVVMRSFRQTEFKQAEVKSPALAESVRRTAEQEVAKYALAKFKKEQYQGTAPPRDGNKSDIYTIKGDDVPVKMRAKDGSLLDGGSLISHISEARSSLLDHKKMLSMLSNKELQLIGVDLKPFKDAQGKELKGADRQAALDKAWADRTLQPKLKAAAEKLTSILMQPEVRGMIENGGRVGNGPPLIAESVMSKLKARTEDSNLGRAAQAPAEAAEKSKKPGDIEQDSASRAVSNEAVSNLMKLRESLQSLDPKLASEGTAFDMRLLLEDQTDRQQKGQDSWSPAEIERFKNLTEAYEDPKNPKHEEAVKQVNEAINAECERRINIMGARGTANFAKLTDTSKMAVALQELTERGAQRMPASDKERGAFLEAQLRSALRKQLNVATDRDLPESLRNLKVQVVAGDGAPRVVQDLNSKHPVIEISSERLKANASGAIVDAYSKAAGLALVTSAGEKGNLPVTLRAIEPMIEDISLKARRIVVEQAQKAQEQVSKKAGAVETAASDRRAVIDLSKPLVTAWDGENLSFGSEKFHMNSELEKVTKESSDRVKKLEADLAKAKELAATEKTSESRKQALLLQSQLDAERQNLAVVSELREAMAGQRGAAAQENARGLVKTAADRAIADHLNNRRTAGGGGAGLSRAAAATMVITTLAFMAVGNNPASASESTYRSHTK